MPEILELRIQDFLLQYDSLNKEQRDLQKQIRLYRYILQRQLYALTVLPLFVSALLCKKLYLNRSSNSIRGYEYCINASHVEMNSIPQNMPHPCKRKTMQNLKCFNDNVMKTIEILHHSTAFTLQKRGSIISTQYPLFIESIQF